jgi:hypothetical protein
MTGNEGLPEDVATIGSCAGVRVEIAPHDAVAVDTALAIAGMFEQEIGAERPVGGLGNLDRALGGALTRLRSDGIFTGRLGAMLTLSTAEHPVHAGSVLVVGLGDPHSWRPALMRSAVAAAAREAIRLGVISAGFAPGLLDSGLAADRLDGVPDAMLAGLRDALTGDPPDMMVRWVFCTGTTHFAATTAAFRRGLARLAP